jgi:hypothetical protein
MRTWYFHLLCTQAWKTATNELDVHVCEGQAEQQECFPMAFRCDGEKDCPNGDDEMFCEQASNISPVHQMAESVARQRRGSGSGSAVVTTAGPTGPLDLSDLEALLEDGELDAEGRANAVNEIVAEQLDALGFNAEAIAAGEVAIAAGAATFDLTDVATCADVTAEQEDWAEAAASSVAAATGTIVTLSTYCTENAAGGVTLQVETVVAALETTTAALIAELEAALAVIPGVVGYVVEEVDVQAIVDALAAEMKIFALVENACVCPSSAKGGKSGKSSKGGTTGGVTITLLREGSGSGDSGSGSDMQGRVDAAVTSKKGKKGKGADSEYRMDDYEMQMGKMSKKSSKGVYQEPYNRMRRKGGKSGKSSKGGTTGGVTISLLREGSGSGDSGSGSDMQGRVDAVVTSKKGKKGKGADSEYRMDDYEMKMGKMSKKSSKSVKEGRYSPTCVCPSSSGKSTKSKKGESAAFANGGLARGQKASFVLAGIAGAMAVVGVAVSKARSNRRISAEPSEADPLLSEASPITV